MRTKEKTTGDCERQRYGHTPVNSNSTPPAPPKDFVPAGRNPMKENDKKAMRNPAFELIEHMLARKEKIYEIAMHFGYETQYNKLGEELLELLEAIGEYQEVDGSISHVCEEMADVLIVIEGIVLLSNNDEGSLICRYLDNKVSRTLRRIKKNYYEKLEEEVDNK